MVGFRGLGKNRGLCTLAPAIWAEPWAAFFALANPALDKIYRGYIGRMEKKMETTRSWHSADCAHRWQVAG